MGNELVIAIILGLWMLVTAFGAWIGKRGSVKNIVSGPVFIALLISGASLLLGIFFTLWLRSYLYAPGVMVSLQGTILLSLTGLLIFCLISGIMYTMLASSLSQTEGRRGIANTYAIEALGSLVGGIVFNFVLIHIFGSVQILIMLMIINCIAATLFALANKKTIQAAFGLILIVMTAISSIFLDFEQAAVSMIFPDREVVMSKDTPFGKLVATQHSGQSDLYLNGQVLVSTGDIADREEKVHYAMCLHNDPGHVLMLFGGLDGSPSEVCKYQPSALDYVDQDPWSIEFAERLIISEWPEGINIYKTDPKLYFKESEDKYDLILYNGPAPNTIGSNRFYTRDFYHKLKAHLKPGGIFSTSLPAAGNYLSNEMKLLFSSIHNTLRTEFEHIRIIAGNKTYFLASDAPLAGNITERISNKGIFTDYVNQYYLNDKSIADREQLIKEQLDENAHINTGARPIAAHLSILGWLGLQQVPLIPLILIPLILMGIILLRLSRYNIGLFTTGFTASSSEFLLLIAFQSIYGFIYQMAGLIIMIFMAGLFAGAGFMFKFFKTKQQSFIILQVLTGLFCLAIPYLFQYSCTGWTPGILIGLLTFVMAMVTGIQYQMASHLRQGSIGKVASSTYGADLTGSAFGVFFIGVFAFPLLGILNTVIMLALLNIAVAALIYLKKV